MSAKRRRPETYEAEINGKKVRVTVPENPDPVELMQDAIRDNLSPQAVAVIAGHLHGMVKTTSESVNHEVAWFTEQLLNIVGDQYNSLCEEVGL